MKLVALVRAPPRPEEAAAVLAQASELTVAEARMRLAPEPPALLARLAPAPAEALAVALRAAGVSALALDLRCPTDRDRFPVQRFALEPEGATFTSRAGATLRFAWPDVLAVLRGVRAAVTHVDRTETTRRLSLGRAVITGGLVFSATSRRTVHSENESAEQVVLVYLRDGRAATLAEGELELSSLGAGMQPSRTANMAELARRLRLQAPAAFHDERLLRLGRRSLPFLMGSGSRSETGDAVTTRSDTNATLDVLAEVLRRALVEGLLP